MKLKKIVINTSLLFLFIAIFNSCKKLPGPGALCIVANKRIHKDS